MCKRRKVGVVLMAVGVMLIAVSLLLVLYNRNESQQAEQAVDAVMPVLREKIEQNPLSGDNTASDDMTVAEIDGYGYIGYLSIPAWNVELPVMDRWDYTRLKTAPCRYYGSVKTDDLVIAGHNYPRHFGLLWDVDVGTRVCFTDMDGATYTYEVGSVETLNATDVHPMIETEWDLTLYTCTYSGRQRVTVRCKRVSA